MPKPRRILCLWFPRLAVERIIRRAGLPPGQPIAVLRDTGQMQVICSLTPEAEQAGLRLGQPMRDAMAMCPDLVTRLENPVDDRTFLTRLARWATRFTPWVAEDAPGGLTLDISGCAHLFGGEEALLARIEAECTAFGLSLRAGLADTVGTAWALARYAGHETQSLRTGDAIDQEAHATRSRAAKRRHWERGGAAPKFDTPGIVQHPIAAPGQTRAALAPLPLAALRLSPDQVGALARLGLRRVSDILGMPRAALSRRFGLDVVRRLDQALGVEPEPVSPARARESFSVRLSLPDPIGLEADILAAIDKLLEPLCAKLRRAGKVARQIRLQAFRSDETSQSLVATLARGSHDPCRIRPLLAMKLDELDPGFGLDVIRLEVTQIEPEQTHQHSGHAEATARGLEGTSRLDDLIGRLGGRIGLDMITRLHPAESHLPEKSSKPLAAAWSEPARDWPERPLPRPLTLFDPEPVQAPDSPVPPEVFRWRGRNLSRVMATGPERIAPEWWLDDPAWRSGVRDYWRVETSAGERLWMYYAHGNTMSAGWFCHGVFA